MPHYLIIDCESSGLFSYDKPADAAGQPRLAQIGMIFVNKDLEIESKKEVLIRPRGWLMSDEATRITGLTNEYLDANGGPAEEVIDLYSRSIEGRRIIVGFNTPYDLKLMRAELRIAGRPDLFMTTRSICLMQHSRSIVNALDKRSRVKAPRLEEACSHFGIHQPAGHTGLADAMSVYEIWRKLLEQGASLEVHDPYNKPKAKKPAAKRGRKHEDDEEGDGTFTLDPLTPSGSD